MSNININRDYIATVDVKKSTVSTSGNMKFYITDINTSNIYFKLDINASSNRYIGSYGQKENSDNYRLFLRVIDPNNKPFTVEATRMDKPENFFVVDLAEDQKNQIGTYRCELFIDTEIADKDGNMRLERSTTNSFTYEVTESIMNSIDEEIEADPDYPILDSIIDEFRNLDYATETYVDNAIAGIEIPEVDLSGYATIEAVNEAISGIDLSAYSTTESMNTALADKADKEHTHDEYITSIPDEYITNTELNNALANYTEKSDSNDGIDIVTIGDGEDWYILQAEDIEINAQKTYLLSKVEIPYTESGTYKTRSFSHELVRIECRSYDSYSGGKLYTLRQFYIYTNDGYDYFLEQPDGTFVCEENKYYVYNTTLNEYSKTSHTHDEYVTDSELNAKGYLTEHQSLDGYATELYVDEAILDAALGGEEVDLSSYATKQYVDDKFWTGTQSEYDAIATKDPNVIYFIEED